MTSETVPFGKYKGRPVDDMLADTEYMTWLEAQPWFRERFKGLTSRRDSEAASRTPVHNKLQTMFLNARYCGAFFLAASPKGKERCLAQARREVAEGSLLLERLAERHSEQVNSLRQTAERMMEKHKDGAAPDVWRTKTFEEEARDSIARAFEHERKAADSKRLASEQASAPYRWVSSATFEDRGADVRIHVEFLIEYDRPEHDYSISKVTRDTARALSILAVEIKPTVADEYPAVLRQMNRNGSQFLFVDRYEGEGATEEEFVRIFAASGKTVVFKRDVDARAVTFGEKPE